MRGSVEHPMIAPTRPLEEESPAMTASHCRASSCPPGMNRDSADPESGGGGEFESYHFFLASIFNGPLLPPADDVWAVIVTLPDRFAVTTPLADTVALSVLELDQRKLWP